MFEEDRQTAIAMYEKMFEMTPDEDALISYLMSPTRQAVLIARSYDTKDRKLSVKAEAGNEAALVSGEQPARFIETIKDIFSDALDEIPDIIESKNVEKENPEEIVAEPLRNESRINWVKDNGTVEESVPVAAPPVSSIQTEKIPQAETVSTAAAVESDNSTMDVVDAFIKELSIDFEEIDKKPQPDSVDNSLPKTVAFVAPEIIKVDDSNKAKEATTTSAKSNVDNIPNMRFASDFEGLETPDFAIDDVYVPQKYPEEEEPKKKFSFPSFRKNKSDDDEIDDNIERINTDFSDLDNFSSEEPKGTEKLKGGKLVLFLLIAIPLAALGLILVFGIALTFLVLAGAALLMAFRTFQAAFDSFKVFADLLVVAGTGLCISAVGVLLLWACIYFMIGLPSKIINGVINLCLKICTKKEDDEE